MKEVNEFLMRDHFWWEAISISHGPLVLERTFSDYQMSSPMQKCNHSWSCNVLICTAVKSIHQLEMTQCVLFLVCMENNMFLSHTWHYYMNKCQLSQMLLKKKLHPILTRKYHRNGGQSSHTWCMSYTFYCTEMCLFLKAAIRDSISQCKYEVESSSGC